MSDDDKFSDANTISRYAEKVSDLTAENARLRQERDEVYMLNGRMGHLLTTTADALKGPPKHLHMHSWHDLAEVAAKLRADHYAAEDTLRRVRRLVKKARLISTSPNHVVSVAELEQILGES